LIGFPPLSLTSSLPARSEKKKNVPSERFIKGAAVLLLFTFVSPAVVVRLLSAACPYVCYVCYVDEKWKEKDKVANIPIKGEAMGGP